MAVTPVSKVAHSQTSQQSALAGPSLNYDAFLRLLIARPLSLGDRFTLEVGRTIEGILGIESED